MKKSGFLRSDVVVEPLWNAWHAWTLLVPPATAGIVAARHLLPPLQSFVENPHEHARILREPASLGGPYVAIDPARVEEARDHLRATRVSLARQLALADAWTSLDHLLRDHQGGLSLEPLYAAVPEPLRGFVELVYDRRNVAAAKPFERLLYQELHDPSLEAFDLFRLGAEERPFAFSTPRLPTAGRVRATVPFASSAIDTLCHARLEETALGPLAEALGLEAGAHDAFDALFVTERAGDKARFSGDGIRVRYFGHACLLLETRTVAILVDPWIGYSDGDEELGFADLPAHIDYVLITHSHADHLVLETLLQLRGRIGTVVVPRSGWSLLDPSLRCLLERLGFASVREVDALEEIAVPGGSIMALPFLGEHADLAIRAKATYQVRLGGKGVFLAADANNLEPRIYELAARALGPVDVLFVGMECAGAPLDWLYGHFLSGPVSAEAIASRRLDGSDARKALALVDALQPSVAAFVYAMGMEPWLKWLSAVQYDQQSLPIVESDRFVAACRERDLHAERLDGTRELVLED